MPGTLILARHGESEFNAKGLWTGIWDIPLTDKGRGQAKQMGEALADLKPSVAFTSALIRAQETLKLMLAANDWDIPTHQAHQLNERDYGKLTGLNKWEVEKQYGEEQFTKWRRGWDFPVPGGETLKDVQARALPYFQTHIVPLLEAGQTVLVSAHGNSLRALMKYLDDTSDKGVEQLEIHFGEIVIYTFDQSGHPSDKTIRKITTQPTNA
ncbi:MAG TPA: 2,3-bisphosphoglycerate-dependent phosphoglycerate mutase [Candidatus Saccharimonadia bacterium]|nr:2,3-bisphosphoglycerate-dependent phosphoglycerate mutase [Candidatus Saccharimonadia bacterium]